MMEHGFVKTLYKRCRLNTKKLEDTAVIEAKKTSGGKCTETQLEKLAKKGQFQSEIDSDLASLDLFLQHHVEPKPVVVEEPHPEPSPAQEEVEETPAAVEQKEEGPKEEPVPVVEQ